MEKDIVALRTRALEFLKGHTAGVIATVSNENTAHASAVFYVADDAFNVYFLTTIDSRKRAAIGAHPQVAFTVGRLDVPQTLQIEGMASEIQSDNEKAQLVPELMKTLMENNPKYIPVAKMDSTVVLMWLRPTWVRWGDFSTDGAGNDAVFTEIPLS